jgi:transposase-like protein
MALGNRKNPKNAAWSESEYTLLQFMADFPNDETCLNWLWTTRYAADGTHAMCERCEEITPFKQYEARQQHQAWTCTKCSLHVHPTAETIFDKSSTGLHLWFYAMYLMASTRCGISAKQLERELGVTYKTAWRMFTLNRNELMAPDEDVTLKGRVEMDETYMGGKPRRADKAKWDRVGTRQSAAQMWSHDKKTPIFGMVERNARILRGGKTKPEILRHGKIVA